MDVLAVVLRRLADVYCVSDRAIDRRAGTYLVVAYFAFVSLRVLLFSAR